MLRLIIYLGRIIIIIIIVVVIMSVPRPETFLGHWNTTMGTIKELDAILPAGVIGTNHFPSMYHIIGVLTYSKGGRLLHGYWIGIGY
jgi:hypothetical protein